MNYRAAEIEPLLAHSKTKVVVCAGRLRDFCPAEFVISLISKIDTLKHIVAVGVDMPSLAHAFPDTNDSLNGEVSEAPPRRIFSCFYIRQARRPRPKACPSSIGSFFQTPCYRRESSGLMKDQSRSLRPLSFTCMDCSRLISHSPRVRQQPCYRRIHRQRSRRRSIDIDRAASSLLPPT